LQLDKLLSSSREILQIPPELDMIVPTNVPEGKSVPLFNEHVETETELRSFLIIINQF
jgi:hypothetical protein